MAIDRDALTRVAREVYGPFVKEAIVLSAEAVGQMRQRLTALDRERAALEERMAAIEANFARLIVALDRA